MPIKKCESEIAYENCFKLMYEKTT
jgi:hypothetical protein